MGSKRTWMWAIALWLKCNLESMGVGDQYCVCGIFFFFQAEDGIRDLTVTGVQTCALPISALKKEYVLFTAHMDHIGTPSAGEGCAPRGADSICNGADDDGSGTVAVIEL